MRFTLLILLSLKALSEPWLNVSDPKYLNSLDYKLRSCHNWDESFVSYPVTFGEINFYLEKLKDNNANNSLCIKSIDSINTYLSERFIQSREVVFGFQSGTDNQYFQSKKRRYYKNDNLYLSFSNINSNFAYKFKIIHSEKDNKNYLDESFISYKYKNHVFTAGRINRWWSPSDSYSLIMSNSARPSMGIEYKNYSPIEPKRNLFKFFGYLNYEFFVNKLEKDREISNALLFGNRVTFKPHESFKFSLLRLAQFGGENRPTDSKTILKMLLGQDNTSANLSFTEQPGNQLGGFDFVYSPKKDKNLRIYGQMIGEDEAGYFPSRKMHLFGFKYNLDSMSPTYISIDHIDTYSGIKNYSYNHSLYKSGLRYYGMPIGASIDADSEALKFSLIKNYNLIDLEFSYSDIHLNKNNSLLNFWTSESVDFNQFDVLIKYRYKKSFIDLIYSKRDREVNGFDKNKLIFNIYFKY